MSTPASIPKFAFSHMGMFVADLARMRDFYTRVLGFTVTDTGSLDVMRDTTPRRIEFVFLSRDPKEHHQIVLATGKPEGLAFNPINQISFRMAEFSGLREMYRRGLGEKGEEVPPPCPRHALSVSLHHPPSNPIQPFVGTPPYAKEPLRPPPGP